MQCDILQNLANDYVLLFVTDSVWNLFAKRFVTQFSQLMVHLFVYNCNDKTNWSENFD